VEIVVGGDKSLDAGFLPIEQYPSVMNSISINGGGDALFISTAGSHDLSWGAGTYPYASSDGPNGFSYAFHVLPGFAFNYVSWQVGSTRYYATDSARDYTVPPGEYTAHAEALIFLNVTWEGQGVVTSPDFYFGYNPLPLYPMPFATPYFTELYPIVNANDVSMSATACPGWSFDHWEYKDAQGAWVTHPWQNLTVYMNWWEGTGIRVPEGVTDFEVKAVFEEPSPCGPYGCPEAGCLLGGIVPSAICNEFHRMFPGLDCRNVTISGPVD
jgi:hypothetical protein